MRILLIDDDDGATSAIARMLADHGFVCDVTPRESPRDVKRDIPSAFFHLATHEYAAIVTDINLPGLDGIAGVAHLRRRHFGPIVALTGFALTGEEQTLFDGYLRKPLEAGELAPLLRRLIRSAML